MRGQLVTTVPTTAPAPTNCSASRYRHFAPTGLKSGTVKAGAKFAFDLVLKGKRSVTRMLSTGYAELVLTLPPSVRVVALKTVPARKIEAVPVQSGAEPIVPASGSSRAPLPSGGRPRLPG